jgi:molybdopterin molybdotransferase
MKPDLLDVDAALQRMLAAAAPLAPARRVPLAQALGAVLAAPLRSPLDVPGADNSQMDGYALRCADVPAAGARLPVTQRIAAGHPGRPLAAGEAARIFTGAPIPDGADAVVPQEWCETDGDTVRVLHVPRAGDWVRRRGCDVAAGAVVLDAGRRLAPQDLGQAASLGLAELEVAPRPRVALLSTGDELLEPGEPVRDGAIYDSNRPMLAAMLRAWGCEVVDCGRIPDRLDATVTALRDAAASHDLVVSCGGVSVGGEDHVKPAVQQIGALDMWQIAMKPGKPLAFGALRRADGSSAHFVGLPGNPVSSFVTCALFVRPFVLALQGAAELQPRVLRLPAGADWPRADKRREFLRARIDASGALELYPNQNSAVLSSAVWGHGLIDNPPSQAFRRGDMLRFIPFDGLLT